MSLYLGSEKVKNVTAQITLPVEPSDDLPLADGTASAGVSKKFSRADHVHPMETVEATLVDLPSAEELGAIPAPTSGTTGQVLTKTASGQKWADVPVDDEMIVLGDTNIKLPLSTECNDITYGDGKFIVISYSSTATYSTDAIHWTEITLPSVANRTAITYGNGKFVAVSASKGIIYSTDGINWSSVDNEGMYESVIYGNGKFIATNLGSQKIIYSIDGINWNQSDLYNYPHSTAYGNGKFVVVSGFNNVAAYSTDGINWTKADASSAGSWEQVIYNAGKFVAIGNSATAIYSTDGISWTTMTLPLNRPWISIAYGNDKFVAINSKDNTAIYSTDGINWTATALPSNSGWRAITYGDGKFVAVNKDKSNGIVAYSTDGITWSSTTKVLQSPNGTDIHEQVKEALNLEKEKTILLTKTDIDSMSYEDFKFLIHQFSIGYAIYYYEPTTYIMYGQSLLRATNYDDSCLYFSSLTKKYDNNMHFSTNLGIRDSNDNVLLETDYQEPIPYLKYITLKNTSDGCKVSGGGMLIDQLVTIDLLNTSNTLLLPQARKITLTTSGWSNNQQSVTCTGVNSSATSQEIRVMPADASKASAYVSCGVSCVAQANNKLTFACDKVPTTAIDVYVVMQSLNFLT